MTFNYVSWRTTPFVFLSVYAICILLKHHISTAIRCLSACLFLAHVPYAYNSIGYIWHFNTSFLTTTEILYWWARYNNCLVTGVIGNHLTATVAASKYILILEVVSIRTTLLNIDSTIYSRIPILIFGLA